MDQLLSQKVALHSLPSGRSFYDSEASSRPVQDVANFATNNSDLRKIVEQLPAVIWTTDLDLNITFSSGNARAQLNPGIHPFVGMPLSEFLGIVDVRSPVFQAHYSALRGYTQSFKIEVGDSVFEDSVFWGMVEPVFNSDGTLVGTIGVALEVSQQIWAQKEQARPLDEFLPVLPDGDPADELPPDSFF